MKEQKNAYNNWKCPHCDELFRTRHLMQSHIITYHKDNSKNKFAGDHTIKETKCQFCDRTFTNSSALGLHQKYCKNNPNRRICKGHSISDESKQKISEKLKLYYSGQSIWYPSRENRRSFAEQYFDSIFLDAEKEYHVSRYFLDYAWPEKMCYIEVDGEQHYTEDGIAHDKKRSEELEQLGWVLVDRIRWSDFQKLSKEEKENYIQRVGALVVARQAHNLNIRSGSIPSPAKNNALLLQEERWNIIQSSNIDFTKFGWVGKLAKLFNIAPNKAGEYVKRHYPDFYKTCFIRT